MAKDLVFDSERLEKRQRLRRILIPAAALLGVLIIAAAIALLLRGGRGKAASGGGESGYPYTWVRNGNGSVTLEIDRSAAPGFVWLAPSPDPRMGVETRQDDAGAKTRFTLSPKEAGRIVLTFSLCRREDENDRICELSVLALNAGDASALKADLLSLSLRRLPGTLRGGEDTPFPYVLRTDGDGDLTAVITDGWEPPEDGETSGGDEKQEGWQCVSDNEAAAAPLGVILGDGTATAYVRPGKTPGTARVRIFETERGAELTLELQLEEDGSLAVLAHEMRVGP